MKKIRLAFVFKGSPAAPARTGTYHEVWSDHYEHPNVSGEPISINVLTETNKNALNDFLKKANIKSYPSIVFLDETDGQQRIITTIAGREDDYDFLTKKYLSILNNNLEGNGAGGLFDDLFEENTTASAKGLFGNGLRKSADFSWLIVGLLLVALLWFLFKK